ncbi:hypothetical protein V500_07951 [Pseudogymnoascus sp. VKM F-4518 (FW-2643)]|nr:hypothetical protein V500_07951 [Pseudogymnoascus sp. VKM F-4518 (FW-2643)]
MSSGGTAAIPRKETRIRKSFGKSQRGCSACLKKHTKCDESRPRCLKCIKYSRICTYGETDPSKEWQRNIVTFNASELSEELSKNTSVKSKRQPRSTSDGDSSEVTIVRPHEPSEVPRGVPTLAGEGYSGRDVQALSHFAVVTAGDLIGSRRIWTQEGIQLAFTNDFLMHAILMTGASHLQRLNPEMNQDCKALSTKHLHHSLRSFRNALSSRTYVENNFEAVLATTFLFLMQACSNPIFDPENPTIDAMLQHASGLFDIIRYHHHQAAFTIFQPICTPKLVRAAMPDSGPARGLVQMIESHALGYGTPDPKAKFYMGVIKSLAPVLDAVISRPPFGGAPPNALLLYFIHWLSFLPPEFVVLVNSYDPKALVIMAHYYAVVAFVLSNWKSGWWWLRDRPEYMIKNIAAFVHLGGWGVWMKWPLLVLQFCQESDGSLGQWSALSKIHSDDAGAVETEMGILAAVERHARKIAAEG